MKIMHMEYYLGIIQSQVETQLLQTEVSEENQDMDWLYVEKPVTVSTQQTAMQRNSETSVCSSCQTDVY